MERQGRDKTGVYCEWHYSRTGVAVGADRQGMNRATHNGGVERYYVTG